MLFRDIEATRNRHFKDSRSYVRTDQSEVLHGKDWTARKHELWQRCGGRCEMQKRTYHKRIGEQTFPRCAKEATEPHHIIARSEFRDDRMKNLLALCHECHASFEKRIPRWGEADQPIVKRKQVQQ